MYYLIGILELLFVVFFLYKSYKKTGITTLADCIKLTFILWLVNIGLYNLRLSKLYNPTWQINIIVIIIAVIFYALSRKISLEKNDVELTIKDMKEDKESYNIYSIISTCVFVVSIAVFLYNIKKYGLAILAENKIDKQPFDHYAGYIIYLLVVVAQIKYVLFRVNKNILELVLFTLSLVALILTLNRGPLMYIAVTIYIYELFNLARIKDTINKKVLYGIYALLIGGVILAIAVFGYIGDMRMEYVLENVYKRTINEHYQMSPYIPSGILWVYIYLTSPLENAAYSIINQSYDFTFFNNLFYPFIKLFNNLIGNGDEYKKWLESVEGFTPYLEKKVGLNVSSFIPEAMQDLGYLGVIIYIAIFLALAYFSVALIKKKIKISSIGAITIYSNVISILAWSVFVNSLKIPMLVINIMMIVFIEILNRYGFFKLILNKIKRG